MGHGSRKGAIEDGGCRRSTLPAVSLPSPVPIGGKWGMEIGLVALKSDVEIGPAKAECGHACSAWVLGWPRPFQRRSGDKEWDVGPINGWIGSFEIGAWRNGSMVQGHDRFHDAGNASGCFEVPNL